MFRKLVLFMILILVGLSGCNNTTPTALQKLDHIKLPVGYIPNIQFAPLYVAIDKGYFKDQGIEIEFDYSFETDATALVGANNVKFAVISGEASALAEFCAL